MMYKLAAVHATKKELVGKHIIVFLALTSRVGPAALENPNVQARLAAGTLVGNECGTSLAATIVENHIANQLNSYNSQTHPACGIEVAARTHARLKLMANRQIICHANSTFHPATAPAIAGFLDGRFSEGGQLLFASIMLRALHQIN
jgi:hypothetical protein